MLLIRAARLDRQAFSGSLKSNFCTLSKHQSWCFFVINEYVIEEKRRVNNYLSIKTYENSHRKTKKII